MPLPTFERLRTIALLNRFFRTAMLVGRMPSLLGREVFPTRMRSQPTRVFEDAVLFICDVERCLRALTVFEQRLIAFCILEDRNEWEAARHFHRPQGYVSRRLARTLDLLHEIFCTYGLLRRVEFPPAIPEQPERGCKDEPESDREDENTSPMRTT